MHGVVCPNDAPFFKRKQGNKVAFQNRGSIGNREVLH
jgi:hypothetical protein